MRASSKLACSWILIIVAGLYLTLDHAFTKERAFAASPDPLVYFGVQTTFRLQPASISHEDKVRVTLIMTNKTARDLTFRYSGCIENHIKLFDAKGNYVFRKI